jgi:hypothetical protein
MKHEGDDRRRLRTILVTSVFAAIYLSLVWLNLSEAERRSATLEIFPTGADYLRVDINVVHVDLLRSEMTTRIWFRVAGQLSEDDTSPKTDLQLVLNTVHGQQQFDFAKGQRINPIEAAFALEGNINLYPFDRHKGVLWLFVTMPGSRQTRAETQ